MKLKVKQLVKNMEKSRRSSESICECWCYRAGWYKTVCLGKGDIYDKFSLDQTGKYRVFVENKNDGAVDVEGSYIVR